MGNWNHYIQSSTSPAKGGLRQQSQFLLLALRICSSGDVPIIILNLGSTYVILGCLDATEAYVVVSLESSVLCA